MTRIVVRSWRRGDEEGTMAVLKEGSFSNLWPSFMIAIRRSSTQLVGLIIFAICWLAGAGVATTLASLCSLILVVYLSCLTATMYFFYGPNFKDMKDIETSYFFFPDNHFWVAEDDGQIVGTIAIVRKYNEDNIQSKETNKSALSEENSKNIGIYSHKEKVYQINVDTVAKHCKVESKSCKAKVAWLRRMAVKRSHRGLGIAKQLVQAVVMFCQAQGYHSIFLITTEVHQPARSLYKNMGFEQIAFKPYKHCAGLVTIWTYEFEMIIEQ